MTTKNQIPATLIPGDGIGPEIVDAVVIMLDAVGAPFAWETQQGGMAAIKDSGDIRQAPEDRPTSIAELKGLIQRYQSEAVSLQRTRRKRRAAERKRWAARSAYKVQARVQLYLAIEDIDHSRTKTKSPQTNEIVERFHKTVLNEF